MTLPARRLSLVLLAAAWVTACRPLVGRESGAAASPAARTFCVAMRRDPDSTRWQVSATVATEPGLAALPPHFAERTARIVAVRFLEQRGGALDTGQTRDVRFELSRYGRVASVAVLAPGAPSARDEALAAAVREAAKLRLFDDFPGTIRPDSAVVTMRLATVRRPPTLLPLESTMPEQPVIPLKPTSQVAYPPQAVTVGIGDSILMQFVVREDGRADLATLRLLRGRYREFAEAAREALPSLRFEPARSGGCPVAQLVQLPFDFLVRNR